MQVFSAALMSLQFELVIFWQNELEQKLLIKCWWNWLKVYTSEKEENMIDTFTVVRESLYTKFKRKWQPDFAIRIYCTLYLLPSTL